MSRISPSKYWKIINPVEVLRTKKVLQHNPTLAPVSANNKDSVISLHTYQTNSCKVLKMLRPEDITISLFTPAHNYWLNIDNLNKSSIELIGHNIGLHPLIVEDILSKNQRPKTEEIDNLFTCVMHMLYFNDETSSIESEQVSFVLGKNFLITFQDECNRDLFNPIREKLQIERTRLRQNGSDYLLYALIDVIVDHYFVVLDKLAGQIEKLEEEIMRSAEHSYSMNHINDMRKELMYFKRHVAPVRELLGSIIRSDSTMIDNRHMNYFKDIQDHIIQANDLCETYRDIIANIRDLYLSQMNLKMNEVMKFLAIVTTLLAPATVIGGVFGMNFDRIPTLHSQNGFWLATGIMFVVPLFMLLYFRHKRWF
ncbi:MAG: magnesium/cobalt transporter CorA [Bacteroidetes bacterium]|nr:magnesium/cobalt transporter CorA [Bacteroidota bacterium]